MNKKITYDSLEAVESCSQGLRWFKHTFPDGMVMQRKGIKLFLEELCKRTQMKLKLEREQFINSVTKWQSVCQKGRDEQKYR